MGRKLRLKSKVKIFHENFHLGGRGKKLGLKSKTSCQNKESWQEIPPASS